MGELSEVPLSSPACYTIEDDDEPEVIFVSDNLSEEDSRDGEPSSTTSDINGDDGAQCDGTVDDDECIDDGTQQETRESSDEDEGSGNVLNDFIKLIDLVKSYEKVDKTVTTKFKDGFLFLENLQTQFEETEKNNSEKNEMISELIVELNKLKRDNKQLNEDNQQLKEDNQQFKEDNQQLKEDIQQLTQDNQQLTQDNQQLKEDNKQLKGEMGTQSLQFGMLRSRYVKLEEEITSLKKNEKTAEEPPAPVIPMPANVSLETMKSKADKLQQLFRQLCSKMKDETVSSSDPESVKKSKELKSFQNEVGVLFIKVQHKLSKWAKNQVKMEEELERCRMSLDQLHGMITVTAKFPPATEEMRSTKVYSHQEPQMETGSPPTTVVAVVESSTSQPGSKKRKLSPPALVPLNIQSAPKLNSALPVTTAQQINTIAPVPLSNELRNTITHSPASESVVSSDGKTAIQSNYMKTMLTSIPSPPAAVPMQPSSLQSVVMQKSPPKAMSMQLLPSQPLPKDMPSAPLQALTMKSSPPLVSTSPPPALPDMGTSGTSLISVTPSSPSLYQLPPLPPLNFPLSPLSISTPTSSSKQVISTVCKVSSSSNTSKAVTPQPPVIKPKVPSPVTSVPPQAQATKVESPVKRKRRRAKIIRTTPPHLPQTTSVESRYPSTPPQYSQASYHVHPQYSVSQYTPNGPHQATLQAYKNQMMQLPSSTASQFLPQQQQQISSSSASPLLTKATISPASIPETNKQTSVTPQNKCQVCAMTFATPIQLKLHHAVVHSNKTPSSALSGPAVTSPQSSTSSSSSHQKNWLRPLLVPPPPLQERHQNAASLQRVPSIGQTAVSTSTSTGTTTTTWSTNEPNQKRHCSGLSPLSSVVPSSSIPKSASIPVNNTNNSVNSTAPYDNNNFFSWFDFF